MTHLLPFPSEVAVGVAEDQADHQLRQRMARLGGQRLPLRRLRRGGGRVAEQIELTCIAVRMAVSGRRAHGHLPDSRRERSYGAGGGGRGTLIVHTNRWRLP